MSTRGAIGLASGGMDGLRRVHCTELVPRPRNLVEPSRRRRLSIVCRGFESKSKKEKARSVVGPQDNKVPDVFKAETGVGDKDEVLFEKRLQELKRSGLEQKRVQQEKELGPIDYDSSPSSEKKDNFLLKVGAGVALLGLIVSFALGDYLPSGSPNVQNSEVVKKLTPEEESKLKAELGKYEEVLKASPEEPSALEGAGVVYAELGQYKDAEAKLQKLAEIRQNDVEAWRLLAEVRNAMEDYEGSSAAYMQAMKSSSTGSMVLLKGLTEALIDGKKPEEAVNELLRAQEQLRSRSQESVVKAAEGQKQDPLTDALDPVQVDLLLGKAYASWKRPVDALAVYDGLIKKYPDDFRGYLAKAVLLKEQGRASEAERMFIQARYFAPSKAKFLVDRYANNR